MFLSHIEVTIFFNVKFVFFFFIEELELNLFISKFKGFYTSVSLRKQPTFYWHHHWFLCEVMSEEPAQEFHSDDVSLSIDANF